MTFQKITHLPNLPLLCLQSATEKNTNDAFKGKNTVIDFWTTKCTRCPDALEHLNSLAQQPEYSGIEFSSIVLDECDGARNIIETPDNAPRWNSMHHYYMDKQHKEHAKESLGFNQVPFYVILNENGEIVQKGNKRQIDFDNIPGIKRVEKEKQNDATISGPVGDQKGSTLSSNDRIFCMDDEF